MKIKTFILFFLLLGLSVIMAQEVKRKEEKVDETTTLRTKTINAEESAGDSISFKDGEGNTLIKITDEGTIGSITIPSGSASPGITTNKLYNVGSTLYFNGMLLGGGASAINDLSDAKSDGSSMFLGEGAGTSDDGTNNENTTVGISALNSNTSGHYNTANGYHALYYNNSGSGNTACGYKTLGGNTTGVLNTAIGNSALLSNTTGGFNTANGYEVLYSNTSGFYNAANGYDALHSNTSGNYNTANGTFALYYNNTGSYNTAVGYIAGPDYAYDNLTNTTALGYDAVVTASNTVKIGNSSVTSIGGYAGWTNISDIRYKKNIKEDVPGLSFIMGLKPITYNLDVNALAKKLCEDIRIDKDGNRIKVQLGIEILTSREKKASVRESGFSAQAVETLAKKIGYEFSG